MRIEIIKRVGIQGKPGLPGDFFDVPENEAKILVGMKKAVYAPEVKSMPSPKEKSTSDLAEAAPVKRKPEALPKPKPKARKRTAKGRKTSKQ